MRMAPPLTAGFPKVVPPGGDVVCGKHLPAGTEVYLSIIGMMRRKDVFGDDIDIFRPERFLDCDEATNTRRAKAVDLTFGHGRWLCLGKVFAWMEMHKIFVEVGMPVQSVVFWSLITQVCLDSNVIWLLTCNESPPLQLLRTFDFQVADPDKPWHRTSTITWNIQNLNAVVTYSPVD